MTDYRTWWSDNNEVKSVLNSLCMDLAEKGKIELRFLCGGGNGLCIAEQLWAEREKLC